ncbi:MULTISPECIES: UvrD-helicase domain-containing protein [unclassified Frankia]|uniref:UvrD-helicase domain-containing protein n=1 Tax=unclassified Frankia TaxID=2632575 RepID=UPI002AD229BF|nr:MULTISPECIES: UvrD-helicase domain-containing protein [unclassified Frankia]
MNSRFLADLHIHSKYSRACSRDCDLEHLAWWAARKGIAVVGTGDFTHPAWSQEIATKLVPAEPGLFRLRPDLEADVMRTLPALCRTATRFMLSTEISTIYKRGDKTRKVHHLLYAPDTDAAGRITASLGKIGNLAADGRPILGLDSRDLLEITLGAGEGCYLVPAHVWTPWFAVLGSKSGFDAIEDCYLDLADNIFALETGLSADPPMFWRLSGLDRFRLVSNSDAHSPPMLGREATAFTCDVDYFAMRAALRNGDGFAGTIEFFPEEGKYHLDGHRKCGVRYEPSQTREADGRCPECGRPLTVGVLHRVEALADRDEGHRPSTAGEVRSLVALPEVVGEILGVGPKSKAVAAQVTTLTARLGPELAILGEVPLDAIGAVGSSALVEAIRRLRREEVIRDAGYDGEYGVIRLFDPLELTSNVGTLFDLAPAAGATGAGRSAPGQAVGGSAAVRSAAGGSSAGGSSAAGTRIGRGGARRGRSALAPSVVPAADTAADTAAAAAVCGPPDTGAVTSSPTSPTSPIGTSILAGLDAEQRVAAAVIQGPLLIIAGPGTGKTRTLVHSVAHRVREQGVPAEQCLAVTFTRRAATELRERLDALVGAAAPRILATTFHGLGLRIVRECHDLFGLGAHVRVADEATRADILRDALAGTVTGARNLERVRRELAGFRRAHALAGATAGHELAGHELAGLAQRYDEALRARGLVDLDDLLALPVIAMREHPDLAESFRARWRHVWVDEYQDVDELQYVLLTMLTGRRAGASTAEGSVDGAVEGAADGPVDGAVDANLCAIGDPDQAIYSFRGADVGFFLRFRDDFPDAQVVSLTRNYRSTAAIVDAAVRLIEPATLVPGRTLTAVGQHPQSPRPLLHRAASEAEEAAVVVSTIEQALGGTSFHALDLGVDATGEARLSFADIAVLYRTARQARPVMDALDRHGFPFQQRSHNRFADAPGVGRLLALLDEHTGDVSQRRSVLARLRTAAQSMSDDEVEIRYALDILTPLATECGEDLERFRSEIALGAEVDTLDPRADRISLLTLHASKGLEFGLVIIIGCEDGLLPLRWAGSSSPTVTDAQDPDAQDPGAGDDDGDSEERRLLFVGMTRARGQLVLTHSAHRRRGGAVAPTRPSPFLDVLGEPLLQRRSGPVGTRPRRVSQGHQLRLV